MTVALDESTSLLDLVLAISWLLFDLMNAESEWLAKPNGEWEGHESHLHCKASVSGVKVVKGTAERGFAILKLFALSVRGQQQFQWLPQALEQHRREVPRLTKSK